MIHIDTLLAYCKDYLQSNTIKDFPGAYNGIQVSNSGKVSKIGAAVDANIQTISKAIEAKIDFLIVHHGLFWENTVPITSTHYQKIKLLIENNIALYSCHLPLDAHPEIGNNILISKSIQLPPPITWPITYEKTPIVPTFQEHTYTQSSLKQALKSLFCTSITAIEYGPENLGTVAICSGSGSSVVPQMAEYGIQTLITGELKQSNFSIAQDQGLNLYACGHYATEVFGVKALGHLLSKQFSLPFIFIDNYCPL